jgi:outer membrane protein assembly factor BamB
MKCIKVFISILLFFIVEGCTQVDDYLLGKDNSPQPKKLEAVESNIKISQSWSTSVGKSQKKNDYLKIRPVVSNGLIYTADASGLAQATKKQSGKIKWSTQLKNGIVSGPCLGEGRIAVATNAATLVVLDQTTGKELWEVNLSGESLSEPKIAKHKVITKTIDGKVFAFDLQSGKQMWVVEHGSPSLILKASASPVIAGELALVGFSDGKLDAINIENGQLMWQRSIAYASGSSDVERLVDIDTDPIVKDQVAYLASYQGYVGALSLNDGQFMWRKPASVYKNMFLHESSLYITDSKDVLWSIDAHSGRVNWKQPGLKARNLTEPAFLGNKVVVGDKTGYLHFLDANTGEIVARYQLSSGISTAPTLQGKDLIVLTNNGMLNRLSVS